MHALISGELTRHPSEVTRDRACQQEGLNPSGTPSNHRVGIRRGFRKRLRSPSPPVVRSPHHTPVLTVRIQLGGEEVAAIGDCAETAPVVGKRLGKKLGVWKSARKVHIR